MTFDNFPKPGDVKSTTIQWCLDVTNGVIIPLSWDPPLSSDFVTIGKTEVHFTIPEDFDSRAVSVTKLRERAQAVRADFAKRILEIETQISKFLAIEHTED